MKCKNLEKVYNVGKDNAFCALKEINLEFSNKGLVSIMGKSGSGKSTLINILAGLDTPTAGELVDGDICISKLNADELNTYRKNNIGFIFQNYNLINELNVYENIMLGTQTTLVNQERLDNILRCLDIIDYKYKKVSELSGGQQQRVAIARALYKDSKIVIADEPTGNLDESNSEIIFNILKEISKERLVIVVTHDKESALKYGDRIITVSDGQIVEDSIVDCKEEVLGHDMSSKKAFLNTGVAVRLSWKLMKNKKARMIISSIIAAFSLCLLGLFIMVSQYDFSSTSVSMFEKNKTNFVGIGKGYIDKNSGKLITSSRVIDEETINDLLNEYNITDYDRTYMLNGMILTAASSGNTFIPNNVKFATISSENGLKKYGFNLRYGAYPKSSDEVAITDFLAYSISILRPDSIAKLLDIKNLNDISDNDVLIQGLKNLNEDTLKLLFTDDWKNVIDQQDTLELIRQNPGILLLNSEVDFVSNTFKISSVIKTDFQEKYKDLIYMNEVDLNNDERTKDFSFFIRNYYSNFYVCNSFMDDIYNDMMVFSNAAFLKYSAYKDILKIDKELKGYEIYTSSNFFRDKFKKEFNKNDVGQYTLPNTISMALGKGMSPDIIFKGDALKVLNIFEIPSDYENTVYSNKAIVVSDEYFSNFSKAQSYSCYLNIELPQNKAERLDLINYLNESELYYVTTYTNSIYQLTDVMKVFYKVFIVLIALLILFAAALMSSYLSSLIVSQKREIGIMRAMGMTKSNIGRIYLISGITVTFITVFMSYLFMIALKTISNSLLVKSYLNYFSNNYTVKGLSILSFSFMLFIIIALASVMILLVSMIIPIKKIGKMNPINTIRG